MPSLLPLKEKTVSDPSAHLEDIINRHQQTANLQVVFLDIEKYSKRRTASQIDTIHAFTRLLRHALDDTSSRYSSYAQSNAVDLRRDVIVLPTGDGAAVVFTFDGLHDIHLNFALAMLKRTDDHNRENPCEKFLASNWCNCHSNYLVRIGVSEGKGIVYRDVNAGYNVAGDTVNMAARVMALADGAQICFTADALKQVVDLVDDPQLVDRFVEYKGIEIKHGLKVDVYQYVGEGDSFLRTDPPGTLRLFTQMREAGDRMRKLGLPFPKLDEVDRDQMIRMVEGVVGAMAGMTAAVNPVNVTPMPAIASVKPTSEE